jgi:hypothetical protein
MNMQRIVQVIVCLLVMGNLEHLQKIIESTSESLTAPYQFGDRRVWATFPFATGKPIREDEFPAWSRVSSNGRWVYQWEEIENKFRVRVWDRERDRTLHHPAALPNGVSTLGMCEQGGMLWVNERPSEAEWIEPWWQEWLPDGGMIPCWPLVVSRPVAWTGP